MIYKLIQWLKENKESVVGILMLILLFSVFVVCLTAIINVGFWDSLMFISIVGTLMGVSIEAGRQQNMQWFGIIMAAIIFLIATYIVVCAAFDIPIFHNSDN